MELVAAIAALHAPGSVLIHTDSHAVVTRNTALAKVGWSRSERFWANQPDGDVWSLRCRSISSRGPSSVSL
eukprot:2652026-Alexandrium_andersonii.AAC.1